MQVRILSAQLQEIAESELNEVPSQLEENLEIFRSWLLKQEHLKFRNEDQHLINFLRATKFNLQRAKAKIDAYYTFRSLAPEVTQNMDPITPVSEKYLKTGCLVRLPTPKENPGAPCVVLFRNPQYDPDEVTFIQMMRGAVITCDILLEEDDNYVISGVIVIWDMKGMHLKTALQITPLLLKKSIFYVGKAFPTRMKGFYAINAPTFIQHVFKIAKLLLPKKIGKRMHVYSGNDWEEIYKVIPKSIFPNEYGGEGGHIDDLVVKLLNMFESHRKRLLNEPKYCSDESKRPVESCNVSDMYGIEGSFRKLQID